MRSQRDKSTPRFELPVKIKENACERPCLTDEYTVMVISTYLPILVIFSDKWQLDCNVHCPGDAKYQE